MSAAAGPLRRRRCLLGLFLLQAANEACRRRRAATGCSSTAAATGRIAMSQRCWQHGDHMRSRALTTTQATPLLLASGAEHMELTSQGEAARLPDTAGQTFPVSKAHAAFCVSTRCASCHSTIFAQCLQVRRCQLSAPTSENSFDVGKPSDVGLSGRLSSLPSDENEPTRSFSIKQILSRLQHRRLVQKMPARQLIPTETMGKKYIVNITRDQNRPEK